MPLTGSGSFNNYTETAERQGYRPRYGITDYNAIVVTAASNLKPNSENFEGALAITTSTYGAELDRRPRALDPGTERARDSCRPPVCGPRWCTPVAVAHLHHDLDGRGRPAVDATSLAPDAILPGLFNAGTVQMSFPPPDVTFQAPLPSSTAARPTGP